MRVSASNDSGPALAAAVVTPSNTVSFAMEARGLYIGTTGDVTAVVDGVPILFKNVPTGFFPVRCTRVNDTGTTAQDIVALF